MLNVYRPVPRDLFAATPPVRSRRVLRFFMSWYDAIAGALVVIIMALLVAPILRTTPLMALWLLAYLLYLGAMLAIARAPALRLTLHGAAIGLARWVAWLIYGVNSATFAGDLTGDLAVGNDAGDDLRGLALIQIALALALTAAALLFVVTLDRSYSLAGLSQSADVASWLLFVLPMLRVARYGSMRWIGVLGALVILCDGAARLLGAPGSADLATTLRVVALHVCWLALVSLLPAIALRSLTEERAGLASVIAIARAITALQPTSEGEFADEAAALIARRMGFDEVNVLLATSSDDGAGRGLRFLGAATDAGRTLAREGYIIEQARGITGWAAVYGQERLVNDVQRDPDQLYFRHPSFPRTCAEFAIPLTLGGVVIGVLDVQSVRAYAFGEDDLDALRAIAAHLALSLDNAQRLTRARGLASVTQRIARRLLSQQDLRAALEQVVITAHDTLRADSVALYPCDAEDDLIGEPVYCGDFRSAPASAARVEARGADSAVTRALRSGQLTFTSYADDTVQGADFVAREGVQAAAIMPLRVGDGGDASAATTLGVIFVNYRARQRFSPEYREWCAALADLAALALQSAMLYQRVVDEERANTWTELHDGMSQDVSYGRMLLEQALETWRAEGALQPIDGQKLENAHQFIAALQRQVRYLLAVWGQPESGDMWRDDASDDPAEATGLFHDLSEHAALVQRTLEMRCLAQLSGDDAPFVGSLRHDARMVAREAAYNAYRHGRATHVVIAAVAEAGELRLTVSDDGCGFDAQRISTKAHGMSSIRRRAARHHGEFTVESSRTPGASGTTLRAVFRLAPSDASAPEKAYEPDRLSELSELSELVDPGSLNTSRAASPAYVSGISGVSGAASPV